MLTTALITVHLIGLALGLGGATIADLMVLRALIRRDRPVGTLLADLSLAIWLGLAVLTVSGLGLVALHPGDYLHRSGFIAKMIVVAVIMVNGTLMHRRLRQLRYSATMLLAGATSTVSWYGALFLAMFKQHLVLSVVDYLALYTFSLLLAWYGYVKLFDRFGRRSLPAELAVEGDRSEQPSVV